MKNALLFLPIMAFLVVFNSCRSTHKLHRAINRKDTATMVMSPVVKAKDSSKIISDVLEKMNKNNIHFKTFSAKIKVNYEDSKGKQPDVNAFIRIYNDSLMWVSINATFLNIEAFRVLITRDSIFILNKIDKISQFRSIDYLKDIAGIPLNFNTLQNLIIGNPIYVGAKVVSIRQSDNHILISTAGDFFKNLITLSSAFELIEHCKLDDADNTGNRTCDLTYSEYDNKLNGFYFSTYREITVSEKTKLDISLSYKQYDFNKELSFPFTIPKNFKKK